MMCTMMHLRFKSLPNLATFPKKSSSCMQPQYLGLRLDLMTCFTRCFVKWCLGLIAQRRCRRSSALSLRNNCVASTA